MHSECTDTIFTSFYELYLNTCLCVLEDWNPITALLKTSLKGLECRDAASLLQNKLYFWGRRKTLAAVQNNKQYIFYNGSTKIVCDITFLGLLVLLFCFKITREEKAWLPLSAFHSTLSSYLFIFSFLSFAAWLLLWARLLLTVASLGYFTYFDCSNVYLHLE